MNTVFTSLLWKEWHEHKWKLASLTAIAVCVPLAFWDGDDPHLMAGPVLINTTFFLPLAAAFIAMGAAASERSAGTLTLLQSLPRRPRLVAAMKLVMGITTVVIPVWLSIALVALAASLADLQLDRDWQQASLPWDFGFEYWPLDLMAMTMLVAISLVAWIAACGVNRENEIRAGAAGLAIVLAVWMGVIAASYLLFERFGAELSRLYGHDVLTGLSEVVRACLPGGISLVSNGVHETLAPWPLTAATYLLTHGGLAWLYITRFGQTEATDRLSPRTAARDAQGAAWLGPPRSTAWTALAWKQFRESLPVVAVCFLCAAGLMLAIGAELSFREHYVDPISIRQWAEIAVGAFTFFGALAGLMAGVAFSMTDLAPRPYAFWRSRPINVDGWFSSKFLIGLLLLAAAFTLPSAISLTHFVHDPDFNATLLLATFVPYCGAVLAGCVLRHTIYAALIGFGLPMGIWAYVGSREVTPTTQFYVMLGISIALTIAAWIAIRKDWSLRM